MNASIDPERLIDRIYEAGLMPSLWPALLGELGAAVGGNGGFLFGVRDGYTSAVNSVEYDQIVPVFLRDGWSERDCDQRSLLQFLPQARHRLPGRNAHPDADR
jgi:hypothetical protein